MMLGIVSSCIIAYLRAKKQKLDTNNLLIIFACSIGIGLLGAKLLYIIISYSPKEIINLISKGSFEFLIQGGLVYYGGLIGGIIAAYVSTIILKESPDKVISAVVPCIPLGHAWGRLGCLLAGCCYGCEYVGVFAVTLEINGAATSTFPIQATESILNFLLFLCWFVLGVV